MIPNAPTFPLPPYNIKFPIIPLCVGIVELYCIYNFIGAIGHCVLFISDSCLNRFDHVNFVEG